jgi:lysine N6-hydroxylase
MSQQQSKVYDLFGVGLGPSNMSLAALLPKSNLHTLFVEKQRKIAWHSGMLIPGSKLQVPFLDDLVTPVDPTSPYSFTNFLVTKKRFYAFLSKGTNFVTRLEYEQYLNWVLKRLDNAKVGEEILEIDFDKQAKLFNIRSSKGRYRAKNLAIGTGHRPQLPANWQPLLSDEFYHSSDLMHKKTDFTGKRVVVIGGGQSGAEVMSYLLCEEKKIANLVWFARRSNFLPLDDIAFTNELFTPDYVKYFYKLSSQTKHILLEEQKLAIDGASTDTLVGLYEKLYEIYYVHERPEKISLFPGHRVNQIEKIKDNTFRVSANSLFTKKQKIVEADVVIVCSGYVYPKLNYIAKLDSLIHMIDDKLKINEDYSLSWKGEDTNSIFILNGARHSHGISDATFSISAWRSASVINKLNKKTVYSNIDNRALISWC